MDIKFIRANTAAVKRNLEMRFKDVSVIDTILELDKRHLANEAIINRCRYLRNLISNNIKKCSEAFVGIPDDALDVIFNDLMKADEPLNVVLCYNKTDLIKLSKYIDNHIKKISDDTLDERDRLIHSVPNMLGINVPVSNDEANNRVECVKDNGNQQTAKQKMIHIEIAEKAGIVDTIRGTKIAGNRGYFLVGDGVRLNMALLMYAMDFLEKRGYTPMLAPHFMNRDVMSLLCQQDDYDETLYKVDDKYLIATSEQPLTGYYMNHKFKNDLPVRFAGISTCYRKETGKHGIDTSGIFRVHQFEKIEQLCLTEPTESDAELENMINVSKEFYDSLGISYRVVTIVSGALNNSAAKKYDLEGFFAGTQTYKELVSCSNCTDYFSRKLNIRNRHGEYVHILNSTLCANTRTICCIIEQYQTEEGIIIPQVLQPYMNKTIIKYVK